MAEEGELQDSSAAPVEEVVDIMNIPAERQLDTNTLGVLGTQRKLLDFDSLLLD